MIKEFQGEFRWASNFWRATQRDGYDIPGNPYGIYPQVGPGCVFVYATNEHYFQACKADNLQQHLAILNAPHPGVAKKMGSKKGYTMPDGTHFLVQLRKDWDIIRLPLMERGVTLKYAQNPNLAKKLILTWPAVMEEGNNWGDMFWGKDLATGKGENWLGLISMNVRERLMFKMIELFFGEVGGFAGLKNVTPH